MNKNTLLALVRGEDRTVSLALKAYITVNKDDNVSKADLIETFMPCSSRSLAISTNALVWKDGGFELNFYLNN